MAGEEGGTVVQSFSCQFVEMSAKEVRQNNAQLAIVLVSLYISCPSVREISYYQGSDTDCSQGHGNEESNQGREIF